MYDAVYIAWKCSLAGVGGDYSMGVAVLSLGGTSMAGKAKGE